jgi:hypothetical protein
VWPWVDLGPILVADLWAAGPTPVLAVPVGAVSVPLVLVPSPAAVLAVLLVVVPSLPAAGLVVAGTRCPPRSSVWNPHSRND